MIVEQYGLRYLRVTENDLELLVHYAQEQVFSNQINNLNKFF